MLAQIGDTARSQKMAEELVRQNPLDTLLNKVAVPFVQAVSDLQRNQPAQAVAHLEIAAPYEFGSGPASAGYSINYVRGEAYLRLKDGAKAAAEYQKILDHHGTDPLDVSYNLSHLGLRTSLRPARQHLSRQVRLPGFLRRLERCRSKSAGAKTSKSRVREAALARLISTPK